VRLHAGVAASDVGSCRTLIAGYGAPGRRDLNFGERFARLAETLDWPEGVVVEDLSCSAHLVLHRLQELRPAKVVVVGAVSRGVDPPGTVRRRVVDLPVSNPGDVHTSLTESIGGHVGLDKVLAVVRHFGGLPVDTVVLEVEAADTSFGLGFSEELAAAVDPLLDAVRRELLDAGSHMMEPAPAASVGSVAAVYPTSASPGRAPGGAVSPAAPPGIDQLYRYAEAHAQVRSLQAFSERCAPIAGLSVVTRFVPAGEGLGASGDWYDVVPLAGGGAGVAMAGIAGAGRVEAVSASNQLAMAVRAFALSEGNRPGDVVTHLDRLVATTGVGTGSTLVYLTVDPVGRTVHVANAGHLPPLVLDPSGRATFLDGTCAPGLGIGDAVVPPFTAQLEPGATVLLCSAGVVAGDCRQSEDVRRVLRLAAANGPSGLDDLCDHLVRLCERPDGVPRAHDASVVGLRIT
jgi:hydrogenase maturation protease